MGAYVLAVIEYLPRARGLEQVYASEHRTLAGAGRADDAEHLALGYAQVYIAQDGVLAELLLKMNELYYLFGHVLRLPAYMYLGRAVRLRAEYDVAVAAVELALYPSQQARDREGQYEVDDANYEIGLERLEALTLYDAGEVVKLRYADDVEHRGILDVYDQVVANLGHDIP